MALFENANPDLVRSRTAVLAEHRWAAFAWTLRNPGQYHHFRHARSGNAGARPDLRHLQYRRLNLQDCPSCPRRMRARTPGPASGEWSARNLVWRHRGDLAGIRAGLRLRWWRLGAALRRTAVRGRSGHKDQPWTLVAGVRRYHLDDLWTALFAGPRIGALVLTWRVCAYAWLSRVTRIVLVFRLHRLRRHRGERMPGAVAAPS
jgi:hypothetical protein